METNYFKKEYWCYINVDEVPPDDVMSYMDKIKLNLNFDASVTSFWIPVKLQPTNITILHYYNNGRVEACPTKL